MTLSAQQYVGMRALFRGALAANSLLYANPSDGEVLSFFLQLTTEASGATALGSAQQAAIGYAFRGLLSGNFPGVSNPNDADVLAFWTQIGTDSAGAAALAVSRYNALKQTLLDSVALNYPGTTNPTFQQLLGYIATVAPSFNGDFGAIFTAQGLTVVHYLRSDLGLHKTGSIVNSWDAVIGPTITELTASVGIGTAGAGLGGHADIGIDGATQGGQYALVLPAPTVPTGVHMWHLGQITSIPSGASALDSDSGFRLTTTFNTTPNMTIWDGSSVGGIVVTAGVWACIESAFDGTANSYGKFGASVSTAGNPGSTIGVSPRSLGCTAAANFLGIRLLAKVTCTGTLANFAIAAAAAKIQAQSYYSGSVT